MSTYTARCEREGKWWVVYVDVAGVQRATQVRRLDHVEENVREILDLYGVDTSEVMIIIDILVPGAQEEVARALALRQRLDEASRDAAAATSAAAKTLVAQGLSLRDAGAVLGVSFQRIQQLVTH